MLIILEISMLDLRWLRTTPYTVDNKLVSSVERPLVTYLSIATHQITIDGDLRLVVRV